MDRHGILSYRAPIKAIPLGDSRSLHGFFQYTGAFIAGVGIVIVIIQNKYISHSSTIPSSTHAILGTTTLSILALTLVMGLIKFIILPSTFRLFKLHGLFGIITYILALTTLCYGVSEVFGCHEEEVPDNGNVTDAMQVVQVCKGKYLPTIIYTLVSGLGASVMLAHALLSFPGTACDQDNLELLIQASQRDMIF